MNILKLFLALSLLMNLAFATTGSNSSVTAPGSNGNPLTRRNGFNNLVIGSHLPRPSRPFSTPDQAPTVVDEPALAEAVEAEMQNQTKRVAAGAKRSNEELGLFCSNDSNSIDPHNQRLANEYYYSNQFMSQAPQCNPFPSVGFGLFNLIPLINSKTIRCAAVGSFESSQRINSFTCDCVQSSGQTASLKNQMQSAFDSKKVKINAIKNELIELNQLNDHIKYVTSILTSQGFDPGRMNRIRPSACNTAEIISIVNSSASQFNVSSDQNKICDSQECSQVGSFVTDALQQLLKLPQGSQAQLTAEFDSMGPVSCFQDAKQAFVAGLVPFDREGKSELKESVSIMLRDLDSNIAGFGDCGSSSISQAFNKVSTLNTILNRPWSTRIDRKSFKAWKSLSRYNPGLTYAIEHIVHDDRENFSSDDCQKIKDAMEKSKVFFTALSNGLDKTNPSEALRTVSQAHVAFLEGTKLASYRTEVYDEMKEDFEKKCTSFANKVRAISCADQSQIGSSLNLYANYLDQNQSEQSCAGSNSESCLERNRALCAMRSESGSGVSALDAVTYRYSRSERAGSAAGSLAENEANKYCPNFENYVRSQNICANEDFALCYRSLQNGSPEVRERLSEVLRSYRATLSGDARLVHENIESISNEHTAQVDEVNSHILNTQGNATIAATRSNGLSSSENELTSLASVMGSVGGGSSSSASLSSTGSMFNAATTQAFGNQARVSAATSGAVMSRFIAAVPPMQNMPQQQQRQQMDQALERSVNQTVADLENKASGTTSASERQKYLDEIAELRRLMADQTARNDLITQQMAAMNQATAEEAQAAPTKRRRSRASVANTSPESPEVQSTGFQTGGGRTSGQAASNNAANSQDLAGAQGFGGGAAAAGRSVSSVSEARDAAPNDSSLRLVVGGAGGQVIPAAQVITITLPGGDEQALKEAILGLRERLNVGEDGYAVVEVIDPTSGRASLVRVKIENDNVILQNFTAEQLRNTTIVSEANTQPRQIRYSLPAMTNLLNQASVDSN